MSDAECRKLIAAMSAIWKNTYKPSSVSTEVAVWMRYLGQYDYALVNAALDAYVVTDTKGFPPSPGQLIDKIQNIEDSGQLTASDAWALVSKAIRRSTYYSDEEYAKLPQEAQKAVGSQSQLRTWALDEDYNEGVVMSQFIRAYNTAINREKDYKKMPSNVKNLIDTITAKNLENNVSQKRERLKAQEMQRLEDQRHEHASIDDKQWEDIDIKIEKLRTKVAR